MEINIQIKIDRIQLSINDLSAEANFASQRGDEGKYETIQSKVFELEEELKALKSQKNSAE